MRFGVLGPLSVTVDEAAITVTAAKQRIVLATLLLHANRVVSFDELVQAVWGDEPAATAKVTVRNYVLRLRQTLGPEAGGRIVTRDPGYLIELRTDELDLLRFSQLARDGGAAARAGDWELAWALFDDALGLWRGAALADVPSELLQRDEVPPLAQARLQALESRVEAALNLGRPAESVSELETLSARFPLRERFHALLMIALYRSGRQAEALGVYRRVRAALSYELGVEPGPELRALQAQILRGDLDSSAADGPGAASPGADGFGADGSGTGPAVVPRQLPAGPAHFTGRAAELSELTELLDYEALDSAQVTAVIGGTPGIGKTALAVYWAQRSQRHFPDGQLYVNLRGFDPAGPPLPPASAIRGFLDALGVPTPRIPVGLDEQVSLYRSLLADQRMLIVLDNARDEQQVRSLIPGGGGCRVLVTSRHNLPGLVASHGAHCLTLDVLTEDESRDFLVRRLREEGLGADPGVLSEVIERCARLPLALAIAAARATTGRRLSLSQLADELRLTPQLDAFDLADPAMNVRGVFDWSFRALTPEAARLFRFTALNPGPELSVDAAASLVQVPRGQARALLRELTRACLLTEPLPGRFTCHDLLRAYAAERCQSEESDADRRTARDRLLDHHLHSALAAMLTLNPNRQPPDVEAPAPGAVSSAFVAPEDALAWFEAERPALLATITAERPDHDSQVWKLAYAMADYFGSSGHWQEWYAAQREAVAAAQRTGDRSAQALSLRLLGQAAASLNSYPEALEHMEQSIALYRELGDQFGQAAAHHDCARICDFLDRHSEELDHSRRALELCKIVGLPAGAAASLNGIGWALVNLGQYEQALPHFVEALEQNRELASLHGEAVSLHNIGYAHHKLEHHGDAIDHLQQSLDAHLKLTNRWTHADTLEHLGDAYQSAGQPARAQDYWRQALVIMTDLARPEAEALRAKLESS
jgi:DNA-binding SARP family transcriptional activator